LQVVQRHKHSTVVRLVLATNGAAAWATVSREGLAATPSHQHRAHATGQGRHANPLLVDFAGTVPQHAWPAMLWNIISSQGTSAHACGLPQHFALPLAPAARTGQHSSRSSRHPTALYPIIQALSSILTQMQCPKTCQSSTDTSAQQQHSTQQSSKTWRHGRTSAPPLPQQRRPLVGSGQR
jgi:hypothetical protein